jgi:endo-1,4-beta-xylanase
MTHAAVLTKHFNSITPENDMKFDALEPTENNFTYGTADKIVAFATSNNMKVRGHALVWHRQNPSWVFSNGSGGNASADVLLARMKNHISNVVRHYRGKVYAWDVVNEAMMEDGDYRTGTESGTDQQSMWYAIIGKSYIAEAFKAAHEADPDAKLFYNDYYNYLPMKRQGIYNMLKELLDAGVPVHGVGLQCHLNIEPSTDPNNQSYYQTVENEEEAIKLYASLGLDVQITEMDVSLYISGKTYTSDQFYTTATFTDALQTEQAERYRQFFELFRKYQGTITGVTLWGIADDNTWLSEFSSGRKDFPLLFDTNHNPKKAYYAVVDF